MKLAFGKHKGKEIEDLPSSYLRWLSTECDDDAIASEASDELKWRDDHNAHKED